MLLRAKGSKLRAPLTSRTTSEATRARPTTMVGSQDRRLEALPPNWPSGRVVGSVPSGCRPLPLGLPLGLPLVWLLLPLPVTGPERAGCSKRKGFTVHPPVSLAALKQVKREIEAADTININK